MTLRMLADVLTTPDSPLDWLVHPYLPRYGITFLHGKTSVGKSPVTWEIARTVSQGLPFFGRPTCTARVLYLEADAAEPLLRPRLRLLPEPHGAWWLAFLVGAPSDLLTARFQDHLAGLRAKVNPGLVVWNTLRQFYTASGVSSEIPQRVYQAIHVAFPQAGHLVVAHDRKSSQDPDSYDIPEESFSGSSAWRDLATVAMHLVQRHGILDLEHTKSQVSELVPPLRLRLSPNGTCLTREPEP